MLLSKVLEQQAKALIANNQRCCIATVVRCESPTSAKPGARALVSESGEIFGWIGGGCAQPAVIRVAAEVLRSGVPALIRITPDVEKVVDIGIAGHKSHCKSGGVLDLFIEPLVQQPELLIIGASPCAQALSTLASAVGYSVVVAAPTATSERFPDAEVIQTFDLSELSYLVPPCVVVATQGKGDKAGLKAALSIHTASIGFIASGKKAAAIKYDLKSDAVLESELNRIQAPFGVDINAQTPEEIAVAALGAVIRARRLAMQQTAYSNKISEQLNHKPQSSMDRPTEESINVGGCCGGSK